MQTVRHEIRDRHHVVGADPRGQQRLVRVAEGGVGEQEAFLLADPLGEVFGTQLVSN